MKGIFVTGTDTGVGKTIITGLLGRFLLDKGYNVITQKWIQTGCRDSLVRCNIKFRQRTKGGVGVFIPPTVPHVWGVLSERSERRRGACPPSGSALPIKKLCDRALAADIKLHLKIMQRDKNDLDGYFGLISPYVFKTPSSPHLASQIENRIINPDKIKESFRWLSRHFNFIIAEGIGGVLVPFNKKGLVIDIVRELDLVVLVVTQNKLGAINHTLLTIEALEKRKIKILGIIFNNPRKEDKRIVKDNPLIIKALANQKVFGVLPWIESSEKLYARFIPIGNKIYKALQI